MLDILVQRRRDQRAAKKFLRKLLKGLTYVPRVIGTDKLKSYGAAKREILPGVEHRQRHLNNRAENSHQPTRQRERHMQRFKSPRSRPRLSSRAGKNISALAGNHSHSTGRIRDQSKALFHVSALC